MNFYPKIILIVAFILFGVLSYLSILPEYDWFGWIIVLTVVFLGFFTSKTQVFFRFVFILISAFIAFRYILFRSFYTLNFSDIMGWIFGGILYLAELYCIFIHLLGLIINIAPTKRKKSIYPMKRHTVDVFIPTYDEDISVAYTTALACKNFDYPENDVKIYILNDGSRLDRMNNPKTQKIAYQRHLSLKKLAEKSGIHYLIRSNGEHAKAGMINEALLGNAFSEITKNEKGLYEQKNTVKTTGEFILILDSDHIPTTDFLKETIGYFEEDPKLFLAQTPHFMINKDPLRHNLDLDNKLPAEGWIFYRYIQRSLDRWNATFFCGSAAVLRRDILEENGGLEGQTITEDCETALQLHSMGYNSTYVDKPMIAGLEPESVAAMLGQRTRWCQGMLQIFFTKNPLFQKGLTLMQRLSYLNECLFWFFPIFRIVFLLAPLCFLYFYINVYNASLLQVFFYAGPYFFMALAASFYLYGRYRPFLQSEIFETIQSITLLPAILSVILNPRKPSFKTTPKGIITDQNTVSWYSIPFFILFILFIIGTIRSFWIYQDDPLLHEAVYLTSFWNFFNLIIVICCIGSLFELKQPEQHYSFPVFNETVQYKNQALKIKRLSLSLILIEKPRRNAPKKGEKITLLGRDGKISGIVDQVSKTSFQLKIFHNMSQKNIKFVYGHSSRWNNIINHYLEQKKMMFLPFYLVKQGIKSMCGAFKSIFKIGFHSILFVFLLNAHEGYANTIQIPLNTFIQMPSSEINTVYSGYRFIIHAPQRWNIQKAFFSLRYQPIPEIKQSDLTSTATLNGNPIDVQITPTHINIDFKSGDLKEGDNIVFLVIKTNLPHQKCQLIDQQILLNLEKSFLTVHYNLKPLSQLSLENIYDHQQLEPLYINFVSPKWNLNTLKSSILAASNIAILTQGRNMHILFSKKPNPKTDNILLNPNSKISFQNGYYSIPITMINTSPIFRQTIIQPNQTYTFEELGKSSFTLRRSNTLVSIRFLIPSNIYLSPNDSLTLNLDLMYGSLFNANGQVEIYLNNKLFSSIRMNNSNNEHLSNYQTKIPMDYLKHSVNEISFRLTSNFQSDTCINPMDEDFFMTIFKSSTLSFPQTKNYVELPNIGLFFNDGFPFDDNFHLYINKLSDNIYMGLLNFFADLSAHHGTPFKNIQIYSGNPIDNNSNMIVVKINPSLPQDTLRFQQSLNSQSNHIRMDISAPNDETLRKGLESIWKYPQITNLSGSGFEFNIKTNKINPLDNKTIILTNILPFSQLSYLANNNKMFFYFLFVISGLIIAVILFWKYKGSTDEN